MHSLLRSRTLILAIMVMALLGNRAFAAGCVTRWPGAENLDVRTITVPDPKTGERLLGTATGVYALSKDGKLVHLSGEQDIRVTRITDPDPKTGARLVGSEKGLFILRADGKIVREPGEDVGRVRTISNVDPNTGVRIIVAEGVYLLGADGALTRVADSQNIGLVLRVTDPDPKTGARLLETVTGVYLLGRDGKLTLPAGEQYLGTVMDVTDADPTTGARLVGSDNGIFVLSADGKLAPLPGSIPGFGPVGDITDADPGTGTRFVVNTKKLYALTADGKLSPVPGAETISVEILSRRDPRTGQRLVGSDTGVYILNADGQLARPSTEPDIGSVSGLTDPDPRTGAYLIATTTGLYVLGADGKVVRPAGDEIGEIETYARPDPETEDRWIGTKIGLYRYLPYINGAVTPTRNSDGQIVFSIDGNCLAGAQESWFRILDVDGHDVHASIFPSAEQHVVMADFGKTLLPEPGMRVELAVIDDSGRAHVISGPFTIHRAMDLKVLSALIAGALATLHTIFFGLLIFFANKSERAAGILMHPLSQATGLWWAWAVQYSPTLQIWLLGRWFISRKAKTRAPSHFLPLPLLGNSGETIMSDKLSGIIRPDHNIWLIGNSGMGKTTIVRNIEAEFFNYPNLRIARKQVGYIPLFVPLRAVANPGEGQRNWATKVAAQILSGQGFLADENDSSRNESLIASIIRRSGFVLILDGANEVPWYGEIIAAALASDRPGLLVTSQAAPDRRVHLFEEWRLPETIANAVKPLLVLYLGPEQGQDAYGRVVNTRLMADIKSGYDVRLIEALYRAGLDNFPQDRVGLYRAIVERLFRQSGEVAEAKLFEFAWRLWLGGERQFSDDGLDEDVRLALESDVQSVARKVGGDRREFRHDQMRGYLAARHVIGAANPLGVLATSEDRWPQSRSEQDLVWSFLHELAGESARLGIYKWSLRQPENRIRLQVAFAAGSHSP
jgi:hypothetical protein